MDEWITAALAADRIRPIEPAELTHGVTCDAASNSWYEGGVSFDWTALHKRLCGSDSHGRLPSCADGPITAAVADLAKAGTAAYSGNSADEVVLVTVVEVASPHWVQPLSDSAQKMSVFSASEPASDGAFRLFAFTKGPPGQASVREDVEAVLASVCAQLVTQGLRVHRFLSSFVIFASSFNSLLQQTAGVHGALKAAGLQLDLHFSCLTPRRAVAVDGTWWTALPLEALTEASVVAEFTTDLFFQWLADSYLWRCLPPVRVFPPVVGDAAKKHGETGNHNEANGLAAQRLLLFERFVRGVVLPTASRVGFTGLLDALPEEGGDLLELAAPMLVTRRVPFGPQRWSMLDMRLTLARMGAYGKDPGVVLRG